MFFIRESSFGEGYKCCIRPSRFLVLPLLHCYVVFTHGKASCCFSTADRLCLSGPLAPITGLQPVPEGKSGHRVDSNVSGQVQGLFQGVSISNTRRKNQIPPKCFKMDLKCDTNQHLFCLWKHRWQMSSTSIILQHTHVSGNAKKVLSHKFC